MGKRANGEGTIYQRKDGRWTAVITIGQGKRKYLYFATQKEAVKALREVHHLKDQGVMLASKDQTVAFSCRHGFKIPHNHVCVHGHLFAISK